jgi:menaquinone-9 beta-reductase
MESNSFDVVCIGGGLAGLSLSILLAQKGLHVAIVEKKTYPLHKVCGEYISMESWNFLERLGVDLKNINPPKITSLTLSTNKTNLNVQLPLGGFGISRYQLDYELYLIALQLKVSVFTNSTFKKYERINNRSYRVVNDNMELNAKLIIAANGKITAGNLAAKSNNQVNFIGVKYHVRNNYPTNNIALHTFNGGYLGSSAIEEGKSCICYMVDSARLKEFKSIPELERRVLFENKNIQNLFQNSEFVWEQCLTISNIYFGKKILHEGGILYLGDSAGAIPPLAGNGMSLAFRSAHVLAALILDWHHEKITNEALVENYESIWNKNFSKRIKTGQFIQRLFLKQVNASIAFSLFKGLKPFQSSIISQTHGQAF